MVYSTGKSVLQATILILCGLLFSNAYAQTLYVGDTLRVGIRPEPINGGPSVAVVSSGAALEVLERQGRYVKVRSASGVEGWVKSAYLSSDKPAQLLLREARAHSAKLEREIANIRSGSNSGQAGQNMDVGQLEQEKLALQDQVEQLQQQIEGGGIEFSSPSPFEFSESNMAPLYFMIGGLIFILSLGFLFGVTWHKHQVTKRLGGLSL